MSQEYKRLSEEQTEITQERRSQEDRNLNTSSGGGSLGASHESQERSPRGNHGNVNTSSMEILAPHQEGIVEAQERGAVGGKVDAKGGPGRFRRFLTRLMTSYPPYEDIIHVRKTDPEEASPNPVPEPEVFPHNETNTSKPYDQSDEPGLRPTWSYMKRQASSHGIMVATLLMINAAQLKTLILMDDAMRDAFWMGSLVLVAISLTLLTCLTVLVTLTVLHRVHTPQHHVVSTHLNDVTVVLSVLVLVCNILTTVFGLTNL